MISYQVECSLHAESPTKWYARFSNFWITAYASARLGIGLGPIFNHFSIVSSMGVRMHSYQVVCTLPIGLHGLVLP